LGAADAALAIVDTTTWQRVPTTVAELPTEGLTIRFRPSPTTRGTTYELASSDGATFGGHGQVLVEDRYFISETVGALTRLDNRVRALPSHLSELRQRRATLDQRIAVAPETAARPFPHRDELQEDRRAVEEVRARLTTRYSEPEEAPAEAPPAAEPTPAASVASPAAQPGRPPPLIARAGSASRHRIGTGLDLRGTASGADSAGITAWAEMRGPSDRICCDFRRVSVRGEAELPPRGLTTS
jgi:hypothetical protein